MDPVTAVGLAASVAQLAGLTLKVFVTLCQYYQSAKGAPTQSRELRSELEVVFDLTASLQVMVEQNPQQIFPRSLVTAVDEFLVVLADMEKRVEPGNVKGIQRLKWPFNENQNHLYISRI